MALSRSRHESEADNGEVAVKSKGDPDARTLHDGKAGGIHGRELVQVRAPEVLPRLFQIAQLARKYS